MSSLIHNLQQEK